MKVTILQFELQKPKYTKEQVIEWISQFKYGDVDSKDYQRKIIDIFLNSIYIFDDRLVLTYNYKGGTETISLKDIEGSDLMSGSPPSWNKYK